MQRQPYRHRGAVRARAAQRDATPWILAMMAGLGIMALGLGLAHGQTPAAPSAVPAPVPEVVQPRTDAPAAGATGTRSGPEAGVITPPSTAATTPVIRPPAVGTMPVIPPPGSPGGDRTVVPK